MLSGSPRESVLVQDDQKSTVCTFVHNPVHQVQSGQLTEFGIRSTVDDRVIRIGKDRFDREWQSKSIEIVQKEKVEKVGQWQ